MCLFVKRGCKPEIAKQDIVCHKLVAYSPGGWSSFCHYSQHKYKWNEVATAMEKNYRHDYWKRYEFEREIEHLEMLDPKGLPFIKEGLHATFNKTSLSQICVIPQGTEFCYGEDNNIVAVKMIVFHTYIDYLVYRIKKYFTRKANKEK